MKKSLKNILFSMFLIMNILGCKTLNTNENINTEDKKSLNILIQNLKIDLKNNEIERLEESIDKSYRNNKMIEELKKIDFSRVNIFTSTPKFSGNEAQNMVGLVYGSNSLYLEVVYLYINQKWKIKKITEK